ncbi:hypothetical protein R9P66_00500, partial [Escherichia coli]
SFWMVTLKAHILPHHDLQPPGCRGSAPPADQWQKCHLRADLMPGPAAVRRLLQYAVLPAERLCHGPVSFCEFHS